MFDQNEILMLFYHNVLGHLRNILFIFNQFLPLYNFLNCLFIFNQFLPLYNFLNCLFIFN